MQNHTKLFRKRIIPDEIIHLKDDTILEHSGNLIITKWNTLKPRSDISYGISAYFIDKNFKVSKVYNKLNHLVYWYCDIIDTFYDKPSDEIIFTDLLLDVIILPDGTVKVLDIDEIADALDKELIDVSCASRALHSLDSLLNIIYADKFETYQHVIEQQEARLTSI